MPRVRPAAVAGRFYPAQRDRLHSQVQSFLQPPSCGGSEVKALIVPHAGYIYSGPIAGHGFHLVMPQAQKIRRVVLVGPSHHVAFRGMALPRSEAFATPLGEVEVDREATATIQGLSGILQSDEPHAFEHALEVELPFLQVLLPDFKVVPLVLGEVAPKVVAETLKQLWGGPETLVIISSDLSHYLDDESARRVDRHTAEQILALNNIGALDACGATGINGLMHLLRRPDGPKLEAHLVDLRNSSETAGEPDRVVGYGAFAFAPRSD